MKTIIAFVVSVLVLLPATSIAGERFDGNWQTTLTCPAKGDTEGYTWKFPSVIQNGNLRGEHGTAGEPGYLLVEHRRLQAVCARSFRREGRELQLRREGPLHPDGGLGHARDGPRHRRASVHV
jgi:hypothetical protein